MNNRIKELRKQLNLTQEEFSSKVNLSRNFIAQIESGSKSPSERTVLDICREFSVNEDWLRTGQGDMFKPQTKNEELLSFVNDVIELEDDSFKKKLVNALTKLDTKDWEYLETIASKLLNE